MSNQPFENELYNHLSTILGKGLGVPMDQRQVDRLSFECNRLAEVLSKRVTEMAKETAQKETLKVCALVLDELDKLKKELGITE